MTIQDNLELKQYQDQILLFISEAKNDDTISKENIVSLVNEYNTNYKIRTEQLLVNSKINKKDDYQNIRSLIDGWFNYNNDAIVCYIYTRLYGESSELLMALLKISKREVNYYISVVKRKTSKDYNFSYEIQSFLKLLK